MVAEEVDLSNAEDTLLSLDHHATERQSFKDLAEMICMFCSGTAAHQDVIQVDEVQGIPRSKMQGIPGVRCRGYLGVWYPESLKYFSSVLESKRHAKKFPKAEGSDDGCFADV